MKEPDDTPKPDIRAGSGPPRPPKVTVRGFESDDQPESRFSPEKILQSLKAVGWVTDDELAAVRPDRSMTAQKALALLLLQGTITQGHIDTVQKSLANTEYIPLKPRN